jgi:hypothetical protein
MTRLLPLAAVTATIAAGLVFAACSGASSVAISDTSTNTDSGAGGVVVGDSGSTDSGTQCAPCQDKKPDPSCTSNDACGCGPYVCPDGGSTDSCTWNSTSNSCGAGKYCYAPGCGKGTCVALGGTEASTNDPQCGCDGLTYFNATVAAAHGVSIDKARACGSGKPCSVAEPCTTGTCNLEVKTAVACADATGTCWVTPTNCGVSLVNRTAHSCSAATCTTECAAIAAGTPWYSGNCPVAQPQ